MKQKFIISALIISLFMTGCGDVKPSLQSDTFKTTMENKSFTVVDNTSSAQYQDSSIEISYIATKENSGYQLEYYSFTSETAAQGYYAKIKEEFAGMGATSEINVSNYSKYTQTYNKKYGVISRVSNTVIYVNADIMYQEEIKTLLKDIGY